MDAGTVSERIAALAPEICGRRQEVEAARRLPADLAEALRATGIFALAVPRAIGGGEATPDELMDAIEALAAADGSTGWCAMVGTRQQHRRRLHGRGGRARGLRRSDPADGRHRRAGGGRGPSGRRRGRQGPWAFASGIANCAWAWAGCLVTEGTSRG